MRLLAVLFLATVSCASTDLLLKQPLMMGCREARIPAGACPGLSDAVIAYVDGDKEAAKGKIRSAITGVAPRDLKMFIKALDALDGVPGSEKFMTPVHEIVAMLEGEAPPDPPVAPVAATVVASATVEKAEEKGPPLFERLRAATVVVLDHPKAHGCAPMAKFASVGVPALCVPAAMGPIVITDVEWSPGCGAETFVLVGDAEEPAWFLRADEGKGFSMHGGAYVVPEGDLFVVGHRLTAKAPLRPSATCAISWAGWRP